MIDTPTKSGHGEAAVGYIRVSTDDQATNSSLQHQQQVISAWCDAQGIELLEICKCTHGGESGKDLERSGLQQAAEVLERHKDRARFLVVSKVDRLTRNFHDCAWIHDVLDGHQVRIIAPEDGLTAREGSSAFQIGLFGWLAEAERRRILSRIHPGQLARLRAGLPINRLPLGYHLVPIDPVPSGWQGPAERVVHDPDTADLVRGLFSMAATTHLGLRGLGNWAEEHAIARKRDLHFSPKRVRDMLTNEFYIGTLEVSFRTTGNDELFKKRENHPALIDQPVFQQVQDALAGRRQLAGDGMSDQRATSLLGGIALCSRCQSTVIPKGTGADLVYVCRQRHVGKCDAPPFPGLRSEGFVLRELHKRLEEMHGHLVETLLQAIDTLPTVLDRRRADAAAEQRVVQQRRHELDADLEDGRVTPVAYAEGTARLQERLRIAEVQLAETDGWSYLARLTAIQEHPGKWRVVPWDLVLAGMDLNDKRMLLRSAFRGLALDDTGLVAADVQMVDQQTFVTTIAKGYVGTLARFPGYDADAMLTTTGWTRHDVPGTDGPHWTDVHGNSISWRAIAARGGVFTPPANSVS